MAETFRKKENEKRKQAKRLEKQKRKEERKAEGPRSLDDMIAYVDENGNILGVPPDQQQKEEIKLEDIVISTPKRVDVEPEPLKGRVEYFDEKKGYGFIKESETSEKYFFHVSSAPQDIAEGKTVSFETERGPRGMSAVQISIIK